MIPERVLHWCGLAFLAQLLGMAAFCVWMVLDGRIERVRQRRRLDEALDKAIAIERRIPRVPRG